MKLVSEIVEHGLRTHFQEALARKKFDKDDVEAGRAFVKAYVEYIHYIEGLQGAAASGAHGDRSETDEKAAHVNTSPTNKSTNEGDRVPRSERNCRPPR